MEMNNRQKEALGVFIQAMLEAIDVMPTLNQYVQSLEDAGLELCQILVQAKTRIMAQEPEQIPTGVPLRLADYDAAQKARVARADEAFLRSLHIEGNLAPDAAQEGRE